MARLMEERMAVLSGPSSSGGADSGASASAGTK